MSAIDGTTLLRSGGPLTGFFALLAVLFTAQEGSWLVSCGAEPSLLSDLLVVSSEDLNILDSDQWRNKII